MVSDGHPSTPEGEGTAPKSRPLRHSVTPQRAERPFARRQRPLLPPECSEGQTRHTRHEISPCVHKTTYMLVCLTRSPNWCSLVPHGHRKKTNRQCQSERNLCNARPSLFFPNEHRYFVADIEVDCATSRGIPETQHDRLLCIPS